jgi:RimJ/RimL family protein N-acetyltransferase
VIEPRPLILEQSGIRLEPLSIEHLEGIVAAASDGELWKLWYTAVPSPSTVQTWFEQAMEGQRTGTMLPWAVREVSTGRIIGSTRYHDIVKLIDRVEIGSTFYAQSYHRSAVNTTCKLVLLTHAFEKLGCKVVGLRTDNFNFRSQRAIEGIGAKKDGVIRHHQARKDGSVRDSVLYSILVGEWPDVKRHLETRLSRHAAIQR